MDLNKLRTFVVVADHGSISSAAETLYRTQPAISNQLKDLEFELNLTLFERRKARIFLTAEGQKLYETAKETITHIDDTALRLRSDKRETEGLIKIAVEQGSVSYLLPKIIAEFKRSFPRVRFEIVSSGYNDIEDLLIQNRVDFLIAFYFYKRDFFETHPVYTFTRSLVASPQYLKQFNQINTIEDLLNLDFIGFGSEFGDLRFWLKHNDHSQLISQFEKRPASIVLTDPYTLNEMLFSGMGAGFSFDDMAGQRAFKKQKLVTLLPQAKPIRVPVDLAWRKARNESYIKESFKEFVMENSEAWRAD